MKIREVLDKMFSDIEVARISAKPGEMVFLESHIDTALSQLKSAMMEMLPEEKEHSKDCWSLEDTGNDSKYRCDCGIAEYNQAITETKARVDEVFR